MTGGIVVASSNGRVGIAAAVDVLRRGGPALDAVEAGTRLVESDPNEHTVGYGGLPNLLGQVELDASIMDGATLAAGAVCAVRNYEHVISVARKVMDELPHVLLAGRGAERFAEEHGFPRRRLLTAEARRLWRKELEQARPEEPGSRARYFDWVREVLRHAQAGRDRPVDAGTVNFIARDRNGNIACAVSTSGWAWKYPGRVGDSPIIGAGNYADNRYGAAACTGRGEMAIRASTARSVVLYMKTGMSLVEAGREAMLDLRRVVDQYAAGMSIIAMDAEGQHAGFSNLPDASYIYMSEEMASYEERPRVYVPATDAG
jgi:beta-aspartyl-peptidase (threonine type)